MLIRALLLCLALAAGLSACRPPEVRHGPQLGCVEIEGVETLLQRPKGATILVDGDSTAPAAAQALGCAAAQTGDRVAWIFTADAADLGDFASLQRRPLFSAPEELSAPISTLRALRRAGADIEIVVLNRALAAPDRRARRAPREIVDRTEGEARNGRLARAYNAARQELAPQRTILLLPPPDGARAPVGLSGYTWRPFGARLPAQSSISLRAEASLRPGLRVRLIPFEDVPVRGAAHRYDGIIEVGPPVDSPARSSAEAPATK